MAEQLVLRAKGLCKRFGAREALKNADVTLKRGETLAIIGGSGSGKSTLLRCLCELERVERGTIEIAGEVMAALPGAGYAPEKKLRDIRRRMGCVFQDFNLFPHFTVLRNLTEAPRAVLGQTRAQAEQNAMAQLALMGLESRAGDYPYQLSGGQKQRVAIARALCMKPDILCFDEPTSALDPQLTNEVLSVMRALAAQGRTMLVVTHEMAFARNVAARVAYMEAGEIMLCGAPEAVFASPRVSAFAGGEAG